MTSASSILVACSAAFATGLLGSAHCLGMCGPLVSAFFMRPGVRALSYFVFHGARLAVYATFGFVAAAVGSTLASSGQVGMVQAVLQMVAGGVMTLLGFELLGLWQLRVGEGFALFGWLNRGFGKALRQGPVLGSAMAGALNGCMPCSMTMAIVANAAALSSPLDGMFLLLAFGAGTLPSMLSASWLLSRLGARARSWLLKLAGLIIVGMGIVSFWHGLRYFLVLYHLLY